MTRLLFWIALVILILMAVRAKLRQMSPKPPAAGRAPRESAPAPEASEKMACCATCGLYFPASEAVRADGRDYCCPAHVRQPPH